MGKYWSIRLFKVFGIRLELHITFILLIVYVGWDGWMVGGMVGGAWSCALILLAFTCVVLHELGHCLVARSYKVPIERILLLPIGGVAQFGRLPRQPSRELLITIAGPAVNFIIVGILYLTIGWPDDILTLGNHYHIRDLLFLLMVFNLVMGIFNLIPVFPMDGGRILRALLAFKFSYLTATKMAVYVARPLAVCGILGSIFYLEHPLTALLFAFIYLGGDMEYKMVKRCEIFRDMTVRDITRHRFLSLERDHTLADVIELMRIHVPQVILVQGKGSIHGLITPESLRALVEKHAPDTPLKEVEIIVPGILQADWPLDFFAEHLYSSEHAILPVYDGGALIGVVDTQSLDEALYWHRANETILMVRATGATKPKHL